MHTSATEIRTARAMRVEVGDDTLVVELSDGRTVSAPIAWYPRLLQGSKEERGRWKLTGAGLGVHWPDLDEDISVEGLLAGQPSGESQASFQRWIERRAAGNAGADEDE